MIDNQPPQLEEVRPNDEKDLDIANSLLENLINKQFSSANNNETKKE